MELRQLIKGWKRLRNPTYLLKVGVERFCFLSSLCFITIATKIVVIHKFWKYVILIISVFRLVKFTHSYFRKGN